ncbi:MAG: hypothetical protein GF330_00500 [Candidatus Eisenbacteria bacterium]|nr:hypothetical protein [Candidatus Eisenbacteria bacterium]
MRDRVSWRGVFSTVLLALVACAGCGYSFSGSSLPGHIRSIAIPVLENESLDATIADEATRSLTDRFLEDNRLKIAGATRADCVLEGTVKRYERKVYSYDASENPEQYIVVIEVAVVLKDRVKNRDLWSDEALQATATYAADEAAGKDDPNRTAEEEARLEALELLAQDVLARTLEQW